MGRYDERGSEARLSQLLARLARPLDFWDRPGGDFGPLTALYGLSRGEAQHVNSLYRLGSKALLRGELLVAAECLGAAAEAGHPGALFRLGVLAARANGHRGENVRFLVAEAARHGHGDARRILAAAAHPRRAARSELSAMEDSWFAGEIQEALGFPPAPSDCS
ncbi:hypothetical protein [Streptomyces tanashiensis]|uniref:hypothetical protein n=1 Tax=Streptomyces tanashiensis TaxID=67367 RepID=UPI001679C39D|nr:hypothetical protein [Streptomyces tanashiensis]